MWTLDNTEPVKIMNLFWTQQVGRVMGEPVVKSLVAAFCSILNYYTNTVTISDNLSFDCYLKYG